MVGPLSGDASSSRDHPGDATEVTASSDTSRATEDNRRRGRSQVGPIYSFALGPELDEIIRMREATDPFSLRDAPADEQRTALVYLVAICDRLNWDFVLGQLASALHELTSGWKPARLKSLTVAQFRRACGQYKRKDGPIEYSRRVSVLHEIARTQEATGFIERLASTHRIGGPEGAAQLLASVSAYASDPLAKKRNALFHELIRRKLLTVVDEENVGPAVDYHLIRFYMRTGRVSVTDPRLAQRLVDRKPVRLSTLTDLRRQVARAMLAEAKRADVSLSVLNDAEWAFARKACRRDEVWCASRKCPLQESCPSASLNPRKMLTEPESRHGLY